MDRQTKPLSWQELLQRKQQAEFVGRAKELAFFRENLFLEVLRKKIILNVFGPGGVGKTTLLRQFRRIAQEMDVSVALADATGANEIDVLIRWAADLKTQSLKPEQFRQLYAEYQETQKGIGGDPRTRRATKLHARRPGAQASTLEMSSDQLHNILSTRFEREELRVLCLKLNIPYEEVEHPGSSKSDFALKLVLYAEHRSRLEDLITLVRDERPMLFNQPTPKESTGSLLQDELTAGFLADLTTIVDKDERTVVLMLDRYEPYPPNVDIWLRKIVNGSFGEVSANIFLVVSGRTKLDDSQWLDYMALMERIQLNPFSEEEALAYLTLKGLTDDKIGKTVLLSSGTLPVEVATAAVNLPPNLTESEKVADTALGLFLEWIDDPVKHDLALNAALPRYLDEDIVDLLLEGPDDALFEWLTKLPFVEQVADEKKWALHRLIREQMLHHLNNHSELAEQSKSIHLDLADYYTSLLDELEGDDVDMQNEQWQQLAVEECYHLLCGELQEDLFLALDRFLDIIESAEAFAPRWAEAIYQAGVDSESKLVEEWGQKLKAGLQTLEMPEPDYAIAIAMYTALADEEEIDPSRKPIVFRERGHTYQLAGDYESALADFEQAIELDPDYAWAFAERGETYRLQKERNKALSDFNQAIELDETYVWAIASRGQVYNEQGKYKQALRDLNRALELDPNMTWALAERGETHRQTDQHDSALDDFNRALELTPNDSWIITGRGQTYRQVQQYELALTDFNRALELDPSYDWAIAGRGHTYLGMKQYELALTDFNHALELDPNYGWATTGRGQTYLAMKQYALALTDFNRALELEASDWEYYQRALTYQSLAKTAEAQVDLAEAIRLAEKAYQKKPEDWRNTFNLALYYLADEELEKAKQLYQEGVGVAGKAPKEMIEMAIDDLQDYLMVFPNHQTARQMVSWLHGHLEGSSG